MHPLPPVFISPRLVAHLWAENLIPLIELTVLWETRMDEPRERTMSKYAELFGEYTENDWKTELWTMRSGAEVSRVSRLKSWIQVLGMAGRAAKSWVKRICWAPETRSAWIAGGEGGMGLAANTMQYRPAKSSCIVLKRPKHQPNLVSDY